MSRFLFPMMAMLLAAALALFAQAHEVEGDIRASELVGLPVAGTDGEVLGRVAALLLDVRETGVNYLVLASGGQEDPRFAHPLEAFRRAGSGLALEDRFARRAPRPAGGHHVPAEQLLGRGVDDRIGNTVGRLHDVVVNLHSGRPRQFLVAFFDQPGGALALPASFMLLQAKGNPVLHAGPHRRT